MNELDELLSLARGWNLAQADRLRFEQLLGALEHRSCERLLLAEEAQRNKLARALHDGPLQYCVATSLRLQPGEAAEERLRQAIGGLKELIWRLSPDTLSDFGLLKTLDHLVRKTGREHGWDLKLKLLPVDLSRAGELSAFRIAEAALDNVVQHAQTEKLSVNLTHQEDAVVLSVQDFGVGFDPATAGRGLGLEIMSVWATAVGGRCQVDSAPGRGTTVIARFPHNVP